MALIRHPKKAVSNSRSNALDKSLSEHSIDADIFRPLSGKNTQVSTKQFIASIRKKPIDLSQDLTFESLSSEGGFWQATGTPILLADQSAYIPQLATQNSSDSALTSLEIDSSSSSLIEANGPTGVSTEIPTMMWVALGLAAVGGVGFAIAGTAKSSSTPSTRGVVADGYIVGAQLYLQTPSGLQILNGVVTGEGGVFFLPAGSNPNHYPLVAVGGVNSDTGLAQLVPLKAPMGATVINPLTTLVQHVIEDSLGSITTEQASIKVSQALGIDLPAGQSLINYDPLANNSLSDLGNQKVAAQIATLMNSTNDGGELALQNIAHAASSFNPQSDAPLDLTNSITLNDVIGNSADSTKITEIQIANQDIQQATSVQDISQAQKTSALEPVIENIATFANEIIDAYGSENLPVVGSQNTATLNRLKGAINAKLKSLAGLDGTAWNSIIQTDAGMVSMTELGEVVNIDFANQTFAIQFKGVYDFNDFVVFDNDGWDWGSSNNLIFKAGVNTSVNMAADWVWDLNLKGGWDSATAWLDVTTNTQDVLGGSYLMTAATAELASLNGAPSNISAYIGPLNMTAQDVLNSNIQLPGANKNTGGTAGLILSIDDPGTVNDGKYTLSEMADIANNFSDVFQLEGSLQANLSLDVDTFIDTGNSNLNQLFPSISFNLITAADISVTNFTDWTKSDQTGWIYLDNIKIDSQDLVNRIVDPILSLVSPILDPLKPIVEFLQYDVLASVNNLSSTPPTWFTTAVDAVEYSADLLNGDSARPDLNQWLGANPSVASLLRTVIQPYDSNRDSKTTVIEMIGGVTNQLDAFLKSSLGEAMKVSLPSMHQTLTDALPYLQTSITVLSELSEFLNSYNDFVLYKNSLEQGSSYVLDLGTIGFNAITKQVNTASFENPFDSVGVQAGALTIPEAKALSDWQKIIELAGKIGLDIPLISSPSNIAKLILSTIDPTAPAVDLLTFTPKIKDWTNSLFEATVGKEKADAVDAALANGLQIVDVFDAVALAFPALAPATPFIDIPLKFVPKISLDSLITAGFDTYGLKTGSVLDGLFLSDNHIPNPTDPTQFIDLPELTANIELMLELWLKGTVAGVGSVAGGFGAGVDATVAIDLPDPNNDGKTRLSEITSGSNSNILAGIAVTADFKVKAAYDINTIVYDTSGYDIIYQANILQFGNQALLG